MKKTKIQLILVFERFKYIDKVALKLLSSLQNPTTEVLITLIKVLVVLGQVIPYKIT